MEGGERACGPEREQDADKAAAQGHEKAFKNHLAQQLRRA